MRKRILPLLVLLTVSFSVVYFLDPGGDLKDQKRKTLTRKERKEFSDAARIHQEFLMLRDPSTNRIPANIRSLELEFAEQLPKHFGTVLLKGSQVKNAQALSWTERGPNNVAGRIRALAIDVRSTSDPITMLAGGASGGMWKSTDGGSTWVKKTTATQLHSVTCVAQDTRSGSQDTWYYGTGENISNSASGEGATYFGNGVFKSTDNGETWAQLASTVVADNTSFTSDWQYIFNIAVHPTSGNVYAATTGGIYRSTNGGTNWTKVLNPNNSNTLKTDVTIAADGTVYAATNSDGGDIVGIRKSTDDGANWTSVSPTLPGTYGRTIIKTAPSSSG
ncbi:MAG: sialidase family protein, partial [Ignavibacteria bacterium]|nr:sialidase family protein [Ignavibacteria bacterium]